MSKRERQAPKPKQPREPKPEPEYYYRGSVRFIRDPPTVQHPPETRFTGGQSGAFKKHQVIEPEIEKEIQPSRGGTGITDLMANAQIINLTQLTLRIKASREADASITTYQPSQNPATIAVTSAEAGEIDGVRVVRNVFGAVQNLPEPQANTFYIVSLPVGERYGFRSEHGREDLIGPNTNDAVYVINDKGARVMDYCHGWVRY